MCVWWGRGVIFLLLTEAERCSDGDVRLVPPPSASPQAGLREGRLEFCFQGLWGAVFDTDWSELDAAVGCQQLGYDSKGMVSLSNTAKI